MVYRTMMYGPYGLAVDFNVNMGALEYSKQNGANKMSGNVVRQIGSSLQCAHPNCSVRVSWRVILGDWVIQAYVCQRHLAWGCELDMISVRTGESLGWEHGYPTGGCTREMRPTQVTPCLAAIRRVDFGRDVNVSDSFPKMVTRDLGGFTAEIPVFQ